MTRRFLKDSGKVRAGQYNLYVDEDTWADHMWLRRHCRKRGTSYQEMLRKEIRRLRRALDKG